MMRAIESNAANLLIFEVLNFSTQKYTNNPPAKAIIPPLFIALNTIIQTNTIDAHLIYGFGFVTKMDGSSIMGK